MKASKYNLSCLNNICSKRFHKIFKPCSSTFINSNKNALKNPALFRFLIPFPCQTKAHMAATVIYYVFFAVVEHKVPDRVNVANKPLNMFHAINYVRPRPLSGCMYVSMYSNKRCMRLLCITTN